jgi:WW domain-binding protein 4
VSTFLTPRFSATGKWTTQEEAHLASQKAHAEAGIAPAASTLSKQPSHTKDEPKRSSNATTTSHAKAAVKSSTTTSQGPVPKQKTLPSKVGKGVPSSLEVNKRRREEKTGPVSSEEAAALAAREAAKKRVLDREKSLLGLYQAY